MATGDIDVEVSVLRVSKLDDLTAGPPEVSTMNLRMEDVMIGTGRTELEQEFAVASDAWVLDHGLDTRFVDVRCYDSTGSQEVLGDVEIVSADRVIVHWAFPTTGVARLVG